MCASLAVRFARLVRGPGSKAPSVGAAMVALVVAGSLAACSDPSPKSAASVAGDFPGVEAEVEAAVWAFHAADTARDAEGVIGLLWSDYEMLVDGQRLDYEQVAAGSRDFMTGLEVFHTTWSDLQVIPLADNLALSSFLFRDSIVTTSGELIQSRGSTTFLWERRAGEWRLRFADADHYPITQ